MPAEELVKVMEKLESKQTDFDNLLAEHNKLLQDMEEKSKKQLSLEETTKQMQNKLNQAIHELETKNDMVCLFACKCSWDQNISVVIIAFVSI
jgi:predicted  nucleic acid-binding Zn-ribbon protein